MTHTTDPSTPKMDIYATVTARIVAAIIAGAGEFQMPWHRPGVSFAIPKNALTQKAYRGTNVLGLWIDADEKKFEHQVWATYRQWLELGAQVRNGEKSSLIVKYGEWIPKHAREETSADDTGDDNGKRLYARAAHVFNITQVDGYEIAPVAPRPDLTVRLAHVDAFLAATGIEFREGGQRAFYRRRAADSSGDFIQMPPRNLFTGTATCTPTESYESTRLHEAGHASGDEHRLNREFGQRFGDKAYAFEELIAELTAAFLCAELGITPDPRPDHAQYLAHWLTILAQDNRAIFTAAARAQDAAEFLKAFSAKAEVSAVPEDRAA